LFRILPGALLALKMMSPKSFLQIFHHCFSAGVDVHLLKDAFEMVVDGPGTDLKGVSDFLVEKALAEIPALFDISLATRKSTQPGGRAFSKGEL
jgi:hypothetical protein